MKVWQIKETGRKNLQQEEQAIPTPGPNEVVLRVEAFSLNYRDKAIIDGTYPLPMPLPLVPGSDAAGEIVAVGGSVRKFSKGDRLITRLHVQWIDGKASYAATGATLGGPLQGVFAEYAVLNEEGVIKFPSYITPGQASTLPIAAVTAWVGLFKHGQLEPSDDVLIQGSGGVSVFALQLAKAAGNRVIALSRSKEKGEKLLKIGWLTERNGRGGTKHPMSNKRDRLVYCSRSKSTYRHEVAQQELPDLIRLPIRTVHKVRRWKAPPSFVREFLQVFK